VAAGEGLRGGIGVAAEELLQRRGHRADVRIGSRQLGQTLARPAVAVAAIRRIRGGALVGHARLVQSSEEHEAVAFLEPQLANLQTIFQAFRQRPRLRVFARRPLEVAEPHGEPTPLVERDQESPFIPFPPRGRLQGSDLRLRRAPVAPIDQQLQPVTPRDALQVLASGDRRAGDGFLEQRIAAPCTSRVVERGGEVDRHASALDRIVAQDLPRVLEAGGRRGKVAAVGQPEGFAREEAREEGILAGSREGRLPGLVDPLFLFEPPL
jgi:hypothetical protein